MQYLIYSKKWWLYIVFLYYELLFVSKFLKNDVNKILKFLQRFIKKINLNKKIEE